MSGTLVFERGVRLLTIDVEVKPDEVFEPDEVFFLNLSNAVNATIGPVRLRDGSSTMTCRRAR